MKTAPLIPTRDIIIFPGIITPIFVGRGKSLKTLEQALIEDNKVLLFLQKDKTRESPVVPKDINTVGVIVNILQTVKMPNGTLKVLVEAKQRVKLGEMVDKKNIYRAEYEEIENDILDEQTEEALKRKVMTAFERYSKLTNKMLPDLLVNLRGIKSINKVFDLIAANLPISVDMKQEILSVEHTEERALKILEVINKEIEIFGLEMKIDSKVKDQINNVQKNYYLKEKIRAMKEELGENNSSAEENDELRQKIETGKFPKYVKEKLIKEIDKLSKMPAYSSEASVVRTYIDTVMELPWNKSTKDILDLKRAEEILEEDHYGLKDVKERILEFLAVKKLNNSMKGSILCLDGPPGTGKTSLAKSIAKAMGREFSRISLGGVRDEAEIRGHRRTYVGAMPGRLIKEIRKVGTKNPLLLLDEIDKMTSDMRGDPSSALLEVLDTEQNRDFEDHYVDMPFDLSDTFFIATSNDISQIPGPLRDRLEIIRLTSYTEYEKLNIVKQHLLKISQQENGLAEYQIKISDEALLRVINEYTAEAGVRNLKRELDRIFRRVAREVLEKDKKAITINSKNLEKYLGKPKFRPEKMRENIGKLGVVNGLAWTAAGGTTLEVQAVTMEGKGNLILTGKLGEIMKESAQVAYSYVRAKKEQYSIKDNFNEKIDLHLHFPEGAVPKDGPSAGITITTAMISILSDRKVRQNIAMTGEITITGEVLPVGGIKEKVLGAHRAGIREVILPFENESDVDNLPREIAKDMKIHFAKVYEDVEKLVFTE